MLVIPTLLRIGWIEPLPYFFESSKMGRDVAEQYIESPVGTMSTQKFQHITDVDPEFKELPTTAVSYDLLQYLFEVYVDNYIYLAIGCIQEKFWHVSNSVMGGIHDVFPPNVDNN